MKKSLWKQMLSIAMVGVMAVGFAGCGSSSSSNADKADGVKIALLTATSGSGAAYGESIKNGAELAVEQINGQSDSVKLNLQVEDTKGDKNEAINAMNKVISKDRVVGVIGPMFSGSMLAAGPIANQQKVVALGTSTTANGITDIGEYIFRNAVPEADAVQQAIVQSHKTLGYKTAAVLYSNNDDQMVSVNKIAQDTLQKEGVQIVATETFANKDTDFSAQLTKIQQAKSDVIVVAALYQEGSLIMKKMREMGMNQPVIGSNGFNSPQFIKTAGSAADGAIVGTPWFPNKDDQKVKDFKKAYHDKYGKDPDQFAAQSYDAVYLFEAAIKQAGIKPGDDVTKARELFRNTLANIKDFVGVTGKFAFTEHRDPKMDLQVLQIKGGEYQPLTK